MLSHCGTYYGNLRNFYINVRENLEQTQQTTQAEQVSPAVQDIRNIIEEGLHEDAKNTIQRKIDQTERHLQSIDTILPPITETGFEPVD